MLTGGNKLLRAASGPYTTAAQFSRTVAEGKIYAGNKGHRRIPRRRFHNGANLRPAEGHGAVSAPQIFRPISFGLKVGSHWFCHKPAICWADRRGHWKTKFSLIQSRLGMRLAPWGSQPSAPYSYYSLTFVDVAAVRFHYDVFFLVFIHYTPKIDKSWCLDGI
jgi:hypothetical protein